MPLKFNVNVVTAKETAELLNALRCLLHSSLPERMSQRTFFASSKANQAGRAAGEVFGCNAAFALFCVQFHVRDQAAEVLISGAALCEQCIAPTGGGCDLRANVGFERMLFGGQMKTRSAIDAVAIEEGHCSHLFFGADAGQFFWDGSAFEKAESGAGV